jgi:release factor glutamine methyltransferase
MNDFAGVTARLKQAGIESPRLEARVLLNHAEDEQLETLIQRRCAREPLAYVLGEKEFWSLSFAVGRGALIPRPETETLIEAALKNFPNGEMALNILDLGTGSGCLLLTLLRLYPRARGIGVDASPDALQWARMNASRLGVEDRCTLQSGNWIEGITPRFDLIVCNPPYVTHGEMAGLAPELAFEPAAALDGGEDGLEAYRALAPQLRGVLAPGGVVLLEIGASQARAVTDILKSSGPCVSTILADLAGRDRGIEARLP